MYLLLIAKYLILNKYYFNLNIINNPILPYFPHFMVKILWLYFALVTTGVLIYLFRISPRKQNLWVPLEVPLMHF